MLNETQKRYEFDRLSLMLPDVAHELRNLMQGISGLAEIEKMRATAPESVVRLEKISELAKFASELSSGLLSMSGFNREKVSGDVAGAIGSVVSIFDAHCAQSVKIQIQLDSRNQRVLLPTSFVKMIAFNLVRNAIDATQATPDPVIRISSVRDGKFLVLKFWNNGPHIAADMLPRLFVDPVSTKSDTAEHGLGLTIVRKLAEQTGGKASVQNVTDGGVCFDISLPIREDVLIPNKILKYDLTGRRFMLIDDEPSVRQVFAMMIEDMGGQVAVCCKSGEEALTITERNFDAVLLDLRMHGLSGQETFMRMAPELQSRVIFVTGDALVPESLEIVKGVVRPVLCKPISSSSLHEVVSKMAGRTV